MESPISSLLSPVQTRAPEPPAGRRPPAKTESREPLASRDSVAGAVRKISDFVRTIRRDLEFSVDEVTGQTVIRVRDAKTEELIRQIPPEEILAIARQLEEVTGVLFKGKA